MEKQLGFHKQDPSDGILEFLTFRSMPELSIFKKGHKVAQDEGPVEFKFKERVSPFCVVDLK